MNIIAAVDKNWGIGRNGKLLVSIPLDQKHFRMDTLGKVCIMGRATFDSLPGGRPLDGRVNIVLSADKNYSPKGAVVCRSVDEVFSVLDEYRGRGYTDDDFFVIGGQSIYELFLPYCDRAHITKIDYAYEADRYMPNLDEDPEWVLAAEGDEEAYFDLIYSFMLYVRRPEK